MTATEERRLKGLLKSALTEVLEERGDLLRDAVRESFENVALLRAIKEGEKSPLTTRRTVFVPKVTLHFSHSGMTGSGL